MFISSLISMTYGSADAELKMDMPRPIKKAKKKNK
jgi:hypothetical protein